MKLEFLQGRYNYYSGKVGELTRQLGLGGIGIIWALKTQNDQVLKVPEQLLPAAILVAIGLACDYLQYVSGTLVWALYHRIKELKKTPKDQEFSAPDWINWPALFFFWIKIPPIIFAYAIIVQYLFYTFTHP